MRATSHTSTPRPTIIADPVCCPRGGSSRDREPGAEAGKRSDDRRGVVFYAAGGERARRRRPGSAVAVEPPRDSTLARAAVWQVAVSQAASAARRTPCGVREQVALVDECSTKSQAAAHRGGRRGGRSGPVHALAPARRLSEWATILGRSCRRTGRRRARSPRERSVCRYASRGSRLDLDGGMARAPAEVASFRRSEGSPPSAPLKRRPRLRHEGLIETRMRPTRAARCRRDGADLGGEITIASTSSSVSVGARPSRRA